MFYRNTVARVSRIVGNYQATRRHLETSIDVAKAEKVSLTLKRSRGNSTFLLSSQCLIITHILKLNLMPTVLVKVIYHVRQNI